MQYDVIIVGAGPAGVSAALEFARTNVRVLVIEKESLPREKPCGGAMPSSVEKLLGIDISKVVKNRTHLLKMYNNYKDEVTSKTSGMDAPVLINRREFDMFLLEQAIFIGRKNIELIDKCRVISVNETGNEVCILLESGKKIKANYLIAADGALGKIASKIGLMKKRKFAQSFDAEIITTNRYYENHKNTMLMNYFCLPHGYGWIFPKEKNRFSCGVGRWGKPIDIKEALNDFIKKSFPSGVIESIKITGYPIPVYNGTQQISTNKILLTGDAAALVDPVSGEGIRFALHSGKVAASVIIKSLRRDIESPDIGVSKTYEKEVNEKIGKELKLKLSFASLAFHSNAQMFYKTFVNKPY